jgi:hypothetical protein
MPRRLKGRILNTQAGDNPSVHLLTLHYRFHILDKAMDDLEGLYSRYPSLVLGESVQPLEDRLNILLSKELLDNSFCVGLS